MALSSTKLALTITLLSMAALCSMPSAKALDGANITIIVGKISCPLTSVLGVIAPVIPIVNAPVSIVCGVQPSVLLTTVTSTTGGLLATLNHSQTLTFNTLTCSVQVTVPANLCSVPLINNILNIPLSLLGIVQAGVPNPISPLSLHGRGHTGHVLDRIRPMALAADISQLIELGVVISLDPLEH